MNNLLLSPPVAMAVFLALAYGLYWLGGAISARGEHLPGKHEPYTGGEQLLPQRGLLTYHAFFRLAMLFGILHMATLVLSTLPRDARLHRTALLYLAAIAVSVFVLTGEEE